MPENSFSPDAPLEVVPSKELKIIYTWQAPSRPFRRRDKEFWKTVLAIIFLVSLILLFVREWFLIAAIIALTFVYYVLSTVEPEEEEFKITNRGMIYAGQTYLWEIINQFWFSEKYGQRMVNFETRTGFPNRLSLLIGKGEEKTIKEILLKFLIEEEVAPNFLDKAADWLQKKVPLESEKPSMPTSNIIPPK